MINELQSNLKDVLSLNKSRSACLVQIILGIIALCNVNLTHLARFFDGNAKHDSKYKRIQRFFAQVQIDSDALAHWVIALFFKPDDKLRLSMDRTNWKFGVCNLNFLVLSACYKGAAVPLYVMSLDKQGNSNTAERIEIITMFKNAIGVERIEHLLADREFIGMKWFSFLILNNISFDIRIKKSQKASNIKGKLVPVSSLLQYLQPNFYATLKGARMLMGHRLYISAYRLSSGEMVILASTSKPENGLKRYKDRWEIETLFACLKGRGFNFENTHITDLQRIKTMFSVLTIAFAWAHKVGDWRIKHDKKISIKKHGRAAISIFRYGLDLIASALLGVKSKCRELNKCIKLLINPVAT